AIQALAYSADNAAVGSIAGAATFIRESKGAMVEQLPLKDVCDLIAIARAEQRPHDEIYQQKLLKAFQAIYQKIEDSNDDLPVSDLSYALIVLSESPQPDSEIIKLWSQQLMKLQLVSGSWPAAAGAEVGSLIATSMAVRALTHVTTEQALEICQRGVKYLHKCIDSDNGWQNLGSGNDTYSQAVVLRSLAEVPTVNYGIIQAGIDTLLSRKNEDGSWGTGLGEPGNVEITSLSLLALVVAGENRFVPARLAKAALTEVQFQLTQATEERDKLSQDFARRIQDECGGVVTERNTLLKQNADLQQQLQKSETDIQQFKDMQLSFDLRRRDLELEMDRVRERSFLLSRRVSTPRIGTAIIDALVDYVDEASTTEKLLASLSLGVIAALIFSIRGIWQWPLPWTKVLVFLVFAVIILVPVLFWTNIRRIRLSGQRPAFNPVSAYDPLELSADTLTRNPSQLMLLRRMYLEMSQDWRPDVREELAYRLPSLVDMPEDLGNRYVEELVYRLGLGPSDRARLETWSRYVTRLDLTERRLLFEQIRRTFLT
ncbi:MAG TPA: hypothetical protein VE961_20190, partial [Pyrinomonadaceae bacterium]|nr:hypothetical protein [Pyrinomonadaceae bacterium]